jgi:hypothetical protein
MIGRGFRLGGWGYMMRRGRVSDGREGFIEEDAGEVR